MCRLLLFVFSALFLQSAVLCQRYVVPDAKLEFLIPRGLQISIPADDASISLVAFHVNISSMNSGFYVWEYGQWVQEVTKTQNGRLTYTIPHFKVKKGDIIHYWIYVEVKGVGYYGRDRVYKVSEKEPHGSGSQPAPPPTPAFSTWKPRPPPTPAPAPPPPPPKPVVTPTISTDRVNTEGGMCRPSLSSRNGGRRACQSEVILDETFSTVNKWSHVIQIGGSQPEDEFTVFTNDPAVFSLKNGNLVIKPILLEEKYGEDFLLGGNLVLEQCTSTVEDECSKQAATYLIQPPVMSARLTTKGKFSFRYGTVEIRAKLPKGDWIVPELWLEPATQEYGSHSGRVVLGLARGNTDFTVVDMSNWLLEAGVLVDKTSHIGKNTSYVSWSQKYHMFKLVWNLDEMVFSVDDQLIARLPSAEGSLDPTLNRGRLTPFDKEFYLTLGVHVAGSRDFPTEVHNKPWKNSDPKVFRGKEAGSPSLDRKNFVYTF